MSDALQLFLAKFFERFKTKNPKAFAIIIVVLTGVFAALNTQEFATLTGSPAWLTTVLKVLVFALALLTGTHTSAITKSGKSF